MANSNQNADAACDIIIVNYNSGAYLSRCVRSVYASDIPVSAIIVDNASIDDSIEQIKQIDKRHHTLTLVENTENTGFATAVNLGSQRGTSPYVMLLNPDCEIHPHTIRKLVAQASSIDDLGILGALVFNEDGTEQRGCRRLEPTFTRSMVTALRLGKYMQSVNLHHEALPETPMSIDAVSGAAMLIKRDAFEAIDGMDEAYFLHVEDLDICRRMRESGRKVYFTPNISIFHHHGASSHSVPVRTEWHKHQGMLRYQSKFQQPNQSWIRSKLTRGVIYLNLGLSVVRKWLAHRSEPKQTQIQSLLLKKRTPLVITGASSDLGQAVLQFVKGERVIAVSRKNKHRKQIGDEIWFNWSYFDKVPADDFLGAEKWLAISPVWTASSIAKVINRFGPISRIVAVSSTSIKAKRNSQNSKEREVVQALMDGELDLLKWGEMNHADVTIARASMVYGGGNNKNIAFIKRVIRWFKFFPMISDGNGLRQPVHVDDLAQGLINALNLTKLNRRTYTFAGGERLSYKEMVSRVFSALDYSENIKLLPMGLFTRIVDIVSIIPGLKFINRDMISRMEDDMIYDIEPAKRDIGYQPGNFRP